MNARKVNNNCGVLVVDDDASQLKTIADILKTENLLPVCCNNAAEAMKAVERHDLNVAILDLRLPDIDGLTLLKQLKVINPDIMVIINTGFATLESAVTAVNEEAFAFVRKMGDVEELLAYVHKAFHAHLVGYSNKLEEEVSKRIKNLSETNRKLQQEISERKIAEQALLESEERFREIIENSRDILFRQNFNTGAYDYISPSLKKSSGFDPGEIMSMGIEEEKKLIHPEDLPGLLNFQDDILKADLKRDKILERQFRLKNKSGQYRWITGNYFLTRDADHNPRFIIGNLRDSTERKQAEVLQNAVYSISQAADRVDKLSELFPAIHKIIQDVMFAKNFYIALFDKKANLISFPYFVDETASAEPPRKPHKGLTEYILRIGKGLLVDLACQQQLEQEGKVELLGEPSPIWLGVPLFVGNETFGVMTVQHYSDPNAYGERELHMLEFVSSQVARAIDRKRTEEQLNKLSIAIEQSPISVIVTDARGTIEYVNSGFCQVTGYTAEEVVGENPRILKSGKMPEEEYKKMWQAITTLGEWRGEFQNKKKNGELYWESASISAIKNSDCVITHFLAVKEDITERKKAAEEKARLEEQLRHAAKMDTIGTLAGGIAHDFNNILQAIRGYVDMCLDEAESGSQIHQDLQHVRQATERAARIIKQILSFSRHDLQKRSPLQVHHVVREALSLLRATLPSTISIHCNINMNCAPVLANPAQIHQVVMNLCTNAYQALGQEGGELTVSLEMETPATEVIKVHPDLSATKYVLLTVSDNGPGINNETLERIFEPFFTTKDVGAGSGLGLSVVHGIVKSHGGEVLVESELGHYTTFKVYLPIVAAEVEKTTQSIKTVSGGSERILFIDDEEVVVAVMKRLLTKRGYDVVAKNNSFEALEAFRANPDKFDLVITDHIMPGINGVKLVKKLLHIRPNLPIIMMSGYGQTDVDWNTQALGIREFITKPVDNHSLNQTIRRILDARPTEEV